MSDLFISRPPVSECSCGGDLAAAVSDAEWDGSSARFTPEQWRDSTILHRKPEGDQDPLVKDLHSLPIREPDGTLNRNAVHAAAARINQVEDVTAEELSDAKSALRQAYEELGEDPPDNISASVSSGTAPLPAEWFMSPELSEPTHTIVEPTGRTYGHVALWGTCHRAKRGYCLTPPAAPDGSYGDFLHGHVGTTLGFVPVGQITMGTPHPSPHIPYEEKWWHYGNTGFAVADITVGEDEHGIWFSGAVRPAKMHLAGDLMAGSLSGHWVDQVLIAVLAVNVPGYPVRPAGVHAQGQVMELAASGADAGVLTDVDVGKVAAAVIRGLGRERRISHLRSVVNG